MTSSDIEIGDIGMLSYRLPVAPVASTSHNQYHGPRRSFSCMTDPHQANLALKWELTSRTQVLTNDPLGLLNPAPAAPSANLVKHRTSSLVSKPFANSNPSQPEVKPTANSSPKEDEVSSLPSISTSLNQMRSLMNQSGISSVYSPKNIKSFVLGRLSDLKITVESSAMPLTQSKSLHAVKNPSLTKERTLTRGNSNSKLRGSHSSLLSQQSSQSSSLNTNQFTSSEINHVQENIKALRLDPSSVAIPIGSPEENSGLPTRTIQISSCNRCSACTQFLYDEEIMNGWSPDDSDLHTICVHCGEKTIPNLSIHIRVRIDLDRRFKEDGGSSFPRTTKQPGRMSPPSKFCSWLNRVCEMNRIFMLIGTTRQQRPHQLIAARSRAWWRRWSNPCKSRRHFFRWFIFPIALTLLVVCISRHRRSPCTTWVRLSFAKNWRTSLRLLIPIPILWITSTSWRNTLSYFGTWYMSLKLTFFTWQNSFDLDMVFPAHTGVQSYISNASSFHFSAVGDSDQRQPTGREMHLRKRTCRWPNIDSYSLYVGQCP